MSYFPETHMSKKKIEFELDLSNYATKSDFQDATGVNTSQFAKTNALPGIISAVDKLDIGKLITTPAHLNNAVENIVVKKAKYNELAKNVNGIHTTNTTN